MKEISSKFAIPDPWGESNSNKPLNNESLAFEDSFIQDISTGSQARNYVPLDDSAQYLAGLERKLARAQGKTLMHRESERKKLIADLARSREDHAINLLNSDVDPSSNPLEHLENEVPGKGLSSINTVDPQGTLGLMMRKCAPHHVALSAEELCELLKADILAKVHDDLSDNYEDDAITPGSADSSPRSPPKQELKQMYHSS